MNLLNYNIKDYLTESGVNRKNINITYQLFGKPLHSASIVLVNHALTGNSDVAGQKKGWWKDLVGINKLIDTSRYTVLAFDIPGNGYKGNILTNYTDFNLKDIAKLWLQAINYLKITNIYACIGGSIGGVMAWQLAVLAPNLINYIIPIAADWKISDWVLAYYVAQETILEHSSRPLYDARIMAIIFYRTPQSLKEKFKRTKNDKGEFNVDSWLRHHGEKLEERFELTAYKLMNHLLATVDICDGKDFKNLANNLKSKVIQIPIDSDLFFVKDENLETHKKLNNLNIENEYHEVVSLHGHDGFLIEYKQITNILKHII